MPSAASYRARSIKGMRDLLPPDTAVWAQVEATARRVFGRYGFDEIRTPIVEETDLFVRGVGEATDIVGKEMYSFVDKRGRNLSLRPESTAPVARAFAQHGLRERPQPVRLFYIGPQFRYERPQKGRYRQFHQIGAEVLGDPGPWSDAEVVVMLMTFLHELGFRDARALVNTVGDGESRARYREQLLEYLEPKAEQLGEDSRRRLRSNPLRILDTKVASERELLQGAPRLKDCLSEESQAHFSEFLRGLDACEVSYEVADHLVRGLDYYTRTVFEIVSPALGAQDALVGGGRYDGLVEEVGGPPTPGIGFAIGLDRLIEILPGGELSADQEPSFLVVPMGDVASVEALRLCEELRSLGLRVTAELAARSARTALRRADRMGVHYVVFLGEDELASSEVSIKNFRSGKQLRLSRQALEEGLKELLEGGE